MRRTILVVSAVTLACATAPRGPSVLTAGTKPAAELYIFNDSGWTLIPSHQEVAVGGELIASLPRQTYARVFVRPAVHEFEVHNRRLKLEVAEGRTYYLLVAYSPTRSWAGGVFGDPTILQEISEEQAGPLFTEMRLEQ